MDAEFEAQRRAQIAQLASTGRKQFGGGTKQVGAARSIALSLSTRSNGEFGAAAIVCRRVTLIGLQRF